jgi:hypothetical protein
MKKYRSAALALAACAVSLSAAACSAGSPAASSSTASSAASASASGQVLPSRMLTVKGTVGSFPVPAGAKIGENSGSANSVLIIFGAIAPSDVSRFYAAELPKAGYTVTTNAMETKDGDSGVIIEFSGHGFKGNISALVKFPYDLAVVGDTNVTTILFSATK